MTTVKEFKDLGVAFAVDDKIDFYDGCAGAISQVCADDINNKPYCYGGEVLYFAWRPLNTLPDNPKFKYEVGFDNHGWRPLLEQSVDIYACDDCYDNSEITIKYVDALKPVNDAAVKPSDDKPVFTPWSETYSSDKLPKIKPVFTQAMADGGELPPVGSDFLHAKKVVTCLSVSDYDGGVVTFAYKDRDSHEPDIACCWNNEAWVKPIDTRTPKQKAVEYMLDIWARSDISGSEALFETIYDELIDK